jgi:photosystem II stability/assembly factor-like uncharacterized protein
MNHRAILACFKTGVTRAIEDQAGSWSVEKQLPELQVTCLAQSPAQESVVYAGTREQGVWRSSDFGQTWDYAGMKGQIVKSLVVSPHNPEILFAGSKPALIFRSKDGGKTWHDLLGFRNIPNRWWWFSPADPPDRRPYVMEIAPSPTERDVILAGVEFGGVFRSEDGGDTWSSHVRGTLRDCHSLKFHALDGNYAYEAGGTGGGASMSRDGGRTWQKARKGLAKNYGIACAADGAHPDTWYASVGPSPWKTVGENPEVYLYRFNRDQRWEPIGWTSHPLNETPTVMVSVPGVAGELYVGTHKGSVWHTTDFGETWLRLPLHVEAIWHSMLVLLPSVA